MQQLLTRLDFLVVGSVSKEYASAIADYERRIGARVKFAVRELRGVPLKDGPERSREHEAERIGAALDSLGGSEIWAFDSRGEDLTSERFAQALVGSAKVVCLIGGAAGLTEPTLRRATRTVSLGRHTMPHQLARLVVTEQCYRALTIARGEPYHW